MDLVAELLLEHSKKQAEKIEAWVGISNDRFDILMEVFLKGDRLTSQRAAWIVGNIGERNPELFLPFLEASINKLFETSIHDAVIRNILKITQTIEIQEELQGKLFEICFSFLQNNYPSAIKAFAISTLENICHDHPELAQEINCILTEKLDFEKPAYLFRAKRFLKRFPVKRS